VVKITLNELHIPVQSHKTDKVNVTKAR